MQSKIGGLPGRMCQFALSPIVLQKADMWCGDSQLSDVAAHCTVNHIYFPWSLIEDEAHSTSAGTFN